MSATNYHGRYFNKFIMCNIIVYQMLDWKGLANVFVLSFKGDTPAHTINIDSKNCQCDLKVKA